MHYLIEKETLIWRISLPINNPKEIEIRERKISYLKGQERLIFTFHMKNPKYQRI